MARSPVFAKLNLKDEGEVLVVDAPDSFEAALATLGGVRVRRRWPAGGTVPFALVFATRRAQVAAAARRLAGLLEGDARLWFAYPKGTSKKYACDFNRDNGWEALGALGFEPVRQIAIDEDWSALRFRRAELIKSLRRAPQRALSAAGRKKAAAADRGRAGGRGARAKARS